MDDLMWNRGPIGGPFALIDHTGKLRTDEDFRGKLLLIYFGYSYCPEVCPTDLQQIGLAVDGLGAGAEAVQPGPAGRRRRLLILSGERVAADLQFQGVQNLKRPDWRR
jgi:hypothetical protein